MCGRVSRNLFSTPPVLNLPRCPSLHTPPVSSYSSTQILYIYSTLMPLPLVSFSGFQSLPYCSTVLAHTLSFLLMFAIFTLVDLKVMVTYSAVTLTSLTSLPFLIN